MSINYFDGQILDVFRNQVPLVDVRSEGEFKQGAFPGALNLPILNNEERHQVGLCYKQKGPNQAIDLGHELVSGENREQKTRAWQKKLETHPNTLFYCFRGGLRSQICQQWLSERGFEAPIINGGYKRVRQELMTALSKNCAQKKFLILSGLTGSLKTNILRKMVNQYNVLDLENLANHRGSVFGSMFSEQPSQISFENGISVELLNFKASGPFFVEDESHKIGCLYLPPTLYRKMKVSPIFVLEIPIEQRAKNIIEFYIPNSGLESFFLNGVDRIGRFIGKKVVSRLKAEISKAFHSHREHDDQLAHTNWVEWLLGHYYDPLYEAHIGRKSELIRGRGSEQEFIQFSSALT